MRLPLSITALLIAATPLAAQHQYSLNVDSPASAMTWDGTTSLGDLKGNKSLNATGTSALLLDNSSAPFGGGEFNGGHLGTNPATIYAWIPNILPFFPPLAEIWVKNLDMEARSPHFSIASSGNFSTDLTMTILSGEIEVQDLTGGTTITPLAGTVANPYTANGTITESGGQVHGHIPIDISISSSSGSISFSFSMVGDIYADADIQSSGMNLASSVFIHGLQATFDVTGGTPNTGTYLAYSLRGLGSTSVNQLGITLDLDRAALAATGNSDSNGNESWSLRVPNMVGTQAWFQACQMGVTSNTITDSIQ